MPRLNRSWSRRNSSFTLSLFARTNNFVNPLFFRIRDKFIPPPARVDLPPAGSPSSFARHALMADRYSLTLRRKDLECSGALETSAPTS